MTDLNNSHQNHEENIVNEKEEKLENQKENTERIKDKEKKEEENSKNLEELRKRIEKLEQEKQEYLNGWQRERADFLNYKKAEEKRFQEVVKFANERLIKSLIPVMDSLELAIESTNKDRKDQENDSYLKGLLLIYSQMKDLLEKEGVEVINPKKGEEVNPYFEEVISEVKTTEVPENKIYQVLEKGYILRGKVIRPARVIVGKN
jgi:molecular chaperone GrpE